MFEPVVFENNTSPPIAVQFAPLVLEFNAKFPNIVFVATDPAPLPTLISYIVASVATCNFWPLSTVVPIKIFEFDHLITKDKLEEDEKFENFIPWFRYWHLWHKVYRELLRSVQQITPQH